MTFAIDTGTEPPAAKSWVVDDTQNITFRDWPRADRTRRQVIEAIEACETIGDLDAYVDAENIVIDALHLFDPEMSASVDQAAEAQRAILRGAEECAARMSGAPVIAQSTQPRKGRKTMFTIDTGDTGGSIGPWLSWTSNGSAMKGFQPMKWVLRDKDGAGNRTENVITAFEAGCVVDLDSLRLGWEKDGGQGVSPERRWNPSISQATPRPDDSKKHTGSFAWSRALNVRVAVSKDKAATWEQGSFAAYAAFERLAPQIMAQHPGDSSLPLVKQTGVESIKLKSGNANVPILEIVKWVQRPDCLRSEAPQIATGTPAPAPTAQPAQAAAPAPAAPAAVPEDAEW